jgi:tetratricopeptide (TPR) repeat protein
MADLKPYFHLLQVSEDSPLEELKAAFRRLSRACHPDLHPDNPKATDEFQRLSEAYKIVSETLRPSGQTDDFEQFEPSQRLTTAQAFYAQATEKAAAGDYKGAAADYTAAIDQDPDFLDAYVKRCQMRFVRGDDPGVLADCRKILRLDAGVAPAYYYQGRVHFQSKSVSSAIAAYSQAIALDENYARAYFHRGLAHLKLNEYSLAREDLQQAMTLFKAQGETNEVYRVQQELQQLEPHTSRKPKDRFSGKHPSVTKNSFVKDLVMTIPKFFVNPSSGLLSTFKHLSARRAMEVGIGYGAISILGLLLAAQLYPLTFSGLNLLEQIVLGMVPFMGLSLMNQLCRSYTHARGNRAGDIFISGATLSPLRLLALMSGLAIQFGSLGILLSCAYLGCNAILMLYFGCTQINKLSEQSATLAVPTFFLVGGGLTYWVYTLLAR